MGRFLERVGLVVVWLAGFAAVVVLFSMMFTGAASATTFVQYCNSNPGPGAGCPAAVYGPLETAAPAGTYIGGTLGTVFTGAANIQYYSTTGTVGLMMFPFCEAVAIADCSTGANGALLVWRVGSIRGAGQVTIWEMNAALGSGQFGLTAQQDILFALGVSLCGLLGVGVGVRLL